MYALVSLGVDQLPVAMRGPLGVLCFLTRTTPGGVQKGGVAIDRMVTNFFRASLTPPNSQIGSMEDKKLVTIESKATPYN